MYSHGSARPRIAHHPPWGDRFPPTRSLVLPARMCFRPKSRATLRGKMARSMAAEAGSSMRMVNTKLRKGYAGRRDRQDENGCACAGLCPDSQVGDRDEHEDEQDYRAADEAIAVRLNPSASTRLDRRRDQEHGRCPADVREEVAMADDMPGSSVGPSANDHPDGADLSAADSVGAGQPPWVRRQFPRQVAWGRRRLDRRSPRGFWLTFTVFAGALAVWAFGGITQDLVGHNEAALLDPHVTAWAVAHRTGWLTSVMKVVTWLGAVAHRRTRRAGRGRLPRLPGSPLADRRAGRLHTGSILSRLGHNRHDHRLITENR